MNRLFLLGILIILFLLTERNPSIHPSLSLSDRAQSCKNFQPSEKNKCWDTNMKEILATETVEQSLKYLELVYSSEDNLSPEGGCHSLAHLVGREAYKHFKNGRNFKLTPNTSYCAYGFYHGFMESLLHDNLNLKFAKDFCEKVDKDLSKEAVNVRTMCFHGIGHGLVGESPDQVFWGNRKALVDISLKQCFGISAKVEDIENCSDGAFNAIALLMEKGKYGFRFDKTNIFEICNNLEVNWPIIKNCYLEVASQLSAILRTRDIVRQSKYIEGIEDNELLYQVIKHVMVGSIPPSIREKDAPLLITECRKLQEKLVKGCLEGLVTGFMTRKGPQGFFDKGLKFCNITILTASERDNCYKTLLGRLKTFYTRREIKSICENFDQKYRSYCKDGQGKNI